MITITDDNFESEVLNATQLVLLDMYAPWCRPCHMLTPILESISDENPNIIVGKMNVDENQNVPNTYQISALPTILVFKDGEMIQKLVGLQSKQTLIKIVNG